MTKSNKNFTIINWEDLRLIKFYARSGECFSRTLSYSDLLIIFYIKGFGEQGYFGSQASLGKLIGMSQEQVCRSLKTLFQTVNAITKEPLLIKKDKTIFFNEKVLLDDNGKRLTILEFKKS